MKKSARKVSHKKPIKYSQSKQQRVSYRYIIVTVSVLLLILLSKYTLTQTHVLGQSTVLLARGGDDGGGGDDHGGSGGGSSGGSSSGGGGSSGGSGSSSGGGSNSSGSGGGSGNDSGRDTNGNRGSQSGSSSVGTTNPETTVDCIGPDGKHFTTTFKSCNDLNNAWGKKNWTFNAVSPVPQVTTIQETPKPEKLEVKVENSKSKINIESNNTEVKLEISDDKLKIKSKDADGNEIELEQKDALKKVNDSLETEGVEIEHATESGEFHIKNGQVTAKTELPISVDPSTKTVSVTTPGGTKEVAVLPNAAVESLLTTNTLDKQNNEIELVNVNNDPTFKIAGIDDKKLFGIIPVALNKTVFVSASTGKITKTEESFFNSFLDIISR